LVLAAANGRLSVAGGGPLVALTKDHFRNARPSTNVMSNDAFELVFASPDRFDLKSMEGATTPYRRAQPVALTAADLKALAGRYESDELRATLDITPGKTGLMARLNEARALGQEFRPVHPDLFQMGPFFLRFRRDEAGKVIALDMTNPVLRNIRFPRR
jgi:hypothetical protein